MRNFYKVLLSTVLLPALSYAQSNYKPGYIVNLKGDTLKGFIDYREWHSNPTSINFKTTIDDAKPHQYTPAEVAFFAINKFETYVRYTGPVSMDAIDVGHMAYSRDTSMSIVTAFFKVLQKGKNLALYSYTDGLKSRFYIAEAPDYTIKELEYRLYYNYSGNDVNGQKGVTVNENTYMKQLFALANKYGVEDNNLQWDIEHAGYNKDDLLKIVRKINHISKEEYEKENAVKGPAFNLFVGAGLNINNFSTPASSSFYAGGGRSQTSYGPAASFGINVFANPGTRQLQFRLEASVAKSKYNFLYNLKVSPYIPFRASFDELSISVAPQIIYNFYNTENFKIYGDVGIAFCIDNFSNSYLGSQSQPNSAWDMEANDSYVFRKTDDGFLLKLGVQVHKNWGIYFQYLTGVAVTSGGYFQMNSTCEQIGLNYFFR